MKKKIFTVAVSAMLGASLAPAAFAEPLQSQDTSQEVVTTAEKQIEATEFQECATGDFPVPESTSDGDQYGPGISEKITDEVREIVNDGLTSTGRLALPEEAEALRYLDDGAILILDENEEILGEITRYQPRSLVRTKGINQEAKDLIEACLGLGVFSGQAAEQAAQALTSPQNAVKFIVRRIGVGAAVGCAGGIIWHYL